MTTDAPTKIDVDPNSPEVQRNVAYLVGRALDQRLHGGPLLDRHPDGFFRIAPDVDDNPGDTEVPYWLQEVRTSRYDTDKPAAVITDHLGNQYELRAYPLGKIHDPNGIIAQTMVEGWMKEGANEERRHLDWLLGEAEKFARDQGDSVFADRISNHRFQPNPYAPFDTPTLRPEDRTEPDPELVTRAVRVADRAVDVLRDGGHLGLLTGRVQEYADYLDRTGA